MIFIDADGCPVVKTAVSIAKEHGEKIVIVKNHSHRIKDDYAEVVTVDLSRDSADFYIVNRVSEGDIVVTQDNGLAAMCLAKKAIPINQNGMVIDSSNIDGMLSSRHISKELRNRGIYTSKSKKRGKQSDVEFDRAFRELLKNKK